MFLGFTTYLARLPFGRKTVLFALFLFIMWWRSYYIFEFPVLTGKYCVGTTQYLFKDANRKDIDWKSGSENRELLVQFWYPAQKTGKKNLSPYVPDIMPFLKDNLKQSYLYYFPNVVFDYMLKGIYTHAAPNALMVKENKKYPVIIFSHGFGSLSNFNTTQLEELASHGYVVVGINHTHDCRITVFPDGRVFPLTKKWEQHYIGYLAKAIDWWEQDVNFVLNKLEKLNQSDPEKRFNGKLDLSNVGIFGHSFGGATATQVCREDKRIKAGINMDGPLFGAKPTKGFTTPFMFMLAEEPLKKFEKPLSEQELKKLWMTKEDEKLIRQIYVNGIPTLCSNIGKDVYYLIVRGASHNTFSDFPLIRKISPLFRYLNFKTGSLDPYRAIKITNTYVVEFFNKYLKKEESMFFDGNKYFPEVVMKMWAPSRAI